MKQDFTIWRNQILQNPWDISPLKFGMSQDEVIEIFGNPDAVSTMRSGGKSLILKYHDIELHFDRKAPHGLCLVYSDDEIELSITAEHEEMLQPITNTEPVDNEFFLRDGNVYFCVICDFLPGEAPDENNEEQMVKQFKYLGETTAYLHRQTEIWNGTDKLDRMVWTYDTIIGEHAAWGDWRAFPEMTPEAENILSEVSRIIKRRLERYGTNENNFGLIHADLRLANLLIEGDQIKVIDFDDCGFGWHLHDLASALSFIEDKQIVPKLVNAWLAGYKKVLPFTDTDFEEIDTFIMMRRLQLTAWLASHQESGPVAELSVGWMDGTMELAERYLRLFG